MVETGTLKHGYFQAASSNQSLCALRINDRINVFVFLTQLELYSYKIIILPNLTI